MRHTLLFRPAALGALMGSAAAACVLSLPTDLTSGSGSPDASDAASVPPDAGPDGTVLAFCDSRQPRPTFCIDYERATAPDDGTAFHGVSGFTSGGVTELDRTQSFSPPASLHLTLPLACPARSTGSRIGWPTRAGRRRRRCTPSAPFGSTPSTRRSTRTSCG